MALIERNTTLPGSVDGAGQAEARREWIETAIAPAALDLSTPALYGLPELNTPLFDGSGLFLDRYDKTAYADGLASQIIGIYTTNKFGRLPPPANLPTNQASWAWSKQPVEVKVPYGIKRRFSAESGGTVTTFKAWDIDYTIVTEMHFIRTLRVIVPFAGNGDVADALSACEAQDNIIHNIGGKSYRYMCGGGAQIVGTNEWEFLHQWQYDPGTRTIPAPIVTDPSDFQLPPNASGSPSGYIRRPFHILGAYGSGDPKTTPPTFYAFNPLTYDDDGYLTLPGVPGDL